VELLVVQRAHQVGPEPDPDPRLTRQPDRRPARVEDLAVLGLGHRGQAELGAPALHRVVGDQRRHQERVPFGHQGGGRRVQQVAVLDGPDPVGHGHTDRLRRIGMGGHVTAPAGRLLGHGADLLR